MKRIYKTKESRKLIPGEYHNFRVQKIQVLPDGKEYFILVDKYGDKHLLPARYYKGYPIVINSLYICHIDKINCQGRIFLEPVHPYYQIGNVYEFKYDKLLIHVSNKGIRKMYFQLIGETGEYAFLPVQNMEQKFPKGIVKCKISYIKKSKIFLKMNYLDL